LIATQLVEAGVDLDFPVVFRVLAPLDSLIQAAGRCNREARLPYGETHVFDLQGSHTPKGIYSTATDQTRVMLQRLQPSDLHEPSIFQYYFRRLYNTVDTDRLEIQKSEQSFDFVQSAEKYRIIPEDTRPIFVHPLDLQRVLQPLREEMLSREKRLSAFFDAFDLAIQSASNALSILQHTPNPPAAFLRTLQPFLVQLYQHSFFQAQQRQLIQHIAGDLYLWQGRYDALLGLVEEVDSTHLIFS
jgi:CRISPR-associated endonuclease/helicase Cas3